MMPTVFPVSSRPTSLFHSSTPQRHVAFRHAMEQREGERQGQLRHRTAIHASGPAELDAAPGQGVDIDAVKSHPVLADHAKVRHLCQHPFVDALQPDDGAIVTAEQRDERVAIENRRGFGE